MEHTYPPFKRRYEGTSFRRENPEELWHVRVSTSQDLPVSHGAGQSSIRVQVWRLVLCWDSEGVMATQDVSGRTDGLGVGEFDQLDFVNLLSQIPDLGGQPASGRTLQPHLNGYSNSPHSLGIDIKGDVADHSTVRLCFRACWPNGALLNAPKTRWGTTAVVDWPDPATQHFSDSSCQLEEHALQTLLFA